MLVLAAGYLVTYLLLPWWFSLEAPACLRNNYCGKSILVIGGLFFSLPVILLSALWQGKDSLLFLTAYLFLLLLGLFDDWAGSKKYSGLKGHLLALWQDRQLTTGSLKALGGGALALWLSYLLDGFGVEMLLDALIFALMVNFFNLLDLRPGRAGKVFIIGSLALLLFIKVRSFYLNLVLGSFLAYFPEDLKGRAMLGDTGSNVLGGVIGFSLITAAGIYLKLFTLTFLLLVHIYSEYRSLSVLIEGTVWLKLIDDWGRK